MKIFKSEFDKLYEELTVLNEAKQDTLNFKNWLIGTGYDEEVADTWVRRFDKIKQFLKGPENDYYYWIKKNSLIDFTNAVADTERVTELKRTKKAEISEGAKLVNETEHWKIYHITNFEASQYYGRDSRWCITGIGTYGDRYWNDYTSRGYDFYFVITKDKYDSRGYDSKFAFAINEDNYCYQIFNQQDNEVTLNEVPYWDEIEFPGINLDELDNNEGYACERCGANLAEEDIYWGLDSECLCVDCWEGDYFHCEDCGEAGHQNNAYVGADSYLYCSDCWCDKFTDCASCGEVQYIDDCYYGPDGDYYCDDCYHDYFFTCENCGEVCEIDEKHETPDGDLCSYCYTEWAESNQEEE